MPEILGHHGKTLLLQHFAEYMLCYQNEIFCKIHMTSSNVTVMTASVIEMKATGIMVRETSAVTSMTTVTLIIVTASTTWQIPSIGITCLLISISRQTIKTYVRAATISSVTICISAQELDHGQPVRYGNPLQGDGCPLWER